MLLDTIHCWDSGGRPYFLLGICPPWDLDDHVQDGLLLVCIEGDIVEGRADSSIHFNIDTVLQGVWSTDLADTKAWRHIVDVLCSCRACWTRGEVSCDQLGAR